MRWLSLTLVMLAQTASAKPLSFEAAGLRVEASPQQLEIYRGTKLQRRVRLKKTIAYVHSHAKSPYLFLWAADADVLLPGHTIKLEGTPPRALGFEAMVYLVNVRSGKRRTVKKGVIEALFSPDGRTVAVNSDHYGPIRILRTRQLGKLLAKRPVAVITVKVPVDKDDPAQVVGLEAWHSPKRVRFSGGCCGSTFTYDYDLSANRLAQVEACHRRSKPRCTKNKPPRTLSKGRRSTVRW